MKVDSPTPTRTAPPVAPRRRGHVAGFVALCVLCVAGAAGYVMHAGQRAEPLRAAPLASPVRTSVAAVTGGPHVMFRNMVYGEANQVALISQEAADGPRAVTDLQCARVHFAAGEGLCLTDRGDLFASHKALFFGPDFKVRHERNLAGTVSRARVSPDGRYGAATVFVSGDSYADEGSFSTRTTIFDMRSADSLGDLEQFAVYKNRKRIQAVDFNFWGVTFANRNGRFFATLGTGGHTYLVRGDIFTRRMDVLRDGVECPSLSPDNTRIAFKQRVDRGGSRSEWRPAVLDLDTLEDHPLADSRNVDDQIEWLDGDTVLYSVDTGFGAPSTWAAAADGTGSPRIFIPDGDSPAVVRN